MEGRRVSRRAQKYNPLFLLFLGMVAAVVVLLIVSIVLGAKLGKANKGLKTAQSQITELQQTVAQLEDDLATARKGADSASDGADKSAAQTPAENGGSSVDKSSWLDLSGHSEVKVKPTTLLDGYQTYYATANVNVRSGPGTTYDRIASVNYGGKVQVAAREGNWMFANTGSQFGWISADYLSKTDPPAQTVTPAKPKTAETTSGNLTTR